LSLRAIVVLAVVLVVAPAASAQRPTVPPPGASPSFLHELYAAGPGTSVATPQTYRREGAIVGGAVVGFLGAMVGLGLCHFDAPCSGSAYWAVGGFALGALAGVGFGGFVGDQFPKR
jgi:hypothetical protein